MNINKFREVIKERNRISDETQDEWDYGIEQCWKQEIEILSEDVESTIIFLRNECTDNEYMWIGEILDDLAKKTQSRELVQTFKDLKTKFAHIWSNYNMNVDVEYAEAILEEGDLGE